MIRLAIGRRHCRAIRGAFNTAARGLGPAEIFSIMCTGHTWYQVAPTIRYEFEGIEPSAVSGRDIFLHIANVYGDAANLNLEYGGPGLAALAMNDRRAITTPRPIRGHGVHHYRFHLLALDQPVRGSVTTVKSLLNAISDHVPSRAILTGVYQR